MTKYSQPEGTPNANRLASLLHPRKQNMVIADIIKASNSMTTFVFKANDGHELAYFTAGSYIPVYVEIDGNVVERPYSLCSSPKQSKEGFYAITVKAADSGYISNYIHENWRIGMEVTLGAPFVCECYDPLRDAKNVIALAGGSGVTPFLSMAQAIIDGDVDCNLTLIYGVNYAEEIIYKEKWSEFEKAANGKFKFVSVVANEDVEGCEKGFITLDVISKYCDISISSLFISGPPAMVSHIKAFLEPLNIKRKFIRYSMSGDSPLNNADEQDEYSIVVHCASETRDIKAKSSETILVALERAGYKPAARCRNGKCGFCRAYVIKGDFGLADVEDGIRRADKLLGYIHPCCSYPTSDMEIVIHR